MAKYAHTKKPAYGICCTLRLFLKSTLIRWLIWYATPILTLNYVIETMTTKEYIKWEKEAIERGYKKYTTTSSTNDYSYFKTIGKNDGSYKYMIEWRVWDWRKYTEIDANLVDRPYSLDVNIMPDSVLHDMRLDMLIGEPLKLGFDKVEEVADNYYKFLMTEGIIIER